MRADAAERLPFADGEFDLVYSSSVVEHVAAGPARGLRAELRRVARGWFVQTPAASFPIEPHSLLPSPTGCRQRCASRYWRLGVAGEWEEIALLARDEMEALFGPARPERFGPLSRAGSACARWTARAPLQRAVT